MDPLAITKWVIGDDPFLYLLFNKRHSNAIIITIMIFIAFSLFSDRHARTGSCVVCTLKSILYNCCKGTWLFSSVDGPQKYAAALVANALHHHHRRPILTLRLLRMYKNFSFVNKHLFIIQLRCFPLLKLSLSLAFSGHLIIPSCIAMILIL